MSMSFYAAVGLLLMLILVWVLLSQSDSLEHRFMQNDSLAPTAVFFNKSDSDA